MTTMTNQIYLRIGKPNRFREQRKDKRMNPILIFIIKWGLVIGMIYFFLDDVLYFLFNVI